MTALAVAVTGSPQRGGFFGGLRNIFRGGRGGGNAVRGGRAQGGGRCGSSAPNHRFGGRDYLVSWRVGCTSFTQGEGAAYCRNNNMRPVSLDSPAKEAEFLGLVRNERQKYFWTGGNVNHGRNPSVSWPSGRTTSSGRWSNTGGAGRPQPDNREGNESCLAVLNNFYNDGVKFHDVSCHHRKPIICEQN